MSERDDEKRLAANIERQRPLLPSGRALEWQFAITDNGVGYRRPFTAVVVPPGGRPYPLTDIRRQLRMFGTKEAAAHAAQAEIEATRARD